MTKLADFQFNKYFQRYIQIYFLYHSIKVVLIQQNPGNQTTAVTNVFVSYGYKIN